MPNATKFQLSDEAKMRLEQYELETATVAKIAMEQRATLTNVVGDHRVGVNFSPVNLGNYPSIAQPEIVAEHQEFVKAYYSGDPVQRKPYLDKIFDHMEKLGDRLNFDCSDPQQIFANGKEAVLASQQATYLENLIRDNPEYYAERYKNDPVKREQMQAECGLAIAMSALGTEACTRAGYSFNLSKPLTYEREIDNDVMLDQTIVMMKAAQQRHDSVIAVMKGETPPRLVVQDLARPGNNALDAAKAYSKGKQTPQQVSRASDAFMAVSRVMDEVPDQKGMREAAGFDKMDLVFIDGKSANELFAKQCEGMSEAAKKIAMQGQVMAALGSCKQRVEIGSVMRDEKGEPKVVIQPIKMDVTKSQPTLKEEYGAIRRHVFNWGPMKCRTAQEKIDRLEAKDTGREARQQELAAKLTSKAAEAARAKNDREIESLKGAATQKIKEYSKDHSNVDEKYFSHIQARVKVDMLPADVKDADKVEASTNGYFNKLAYVSGMKTLGRGPSRESIAKLAMMRAGYSMDQIMSDDPALDDARAKAGKEVTDMLDKSFAASGKKKEEPEAYKEALAEVAHFVKDCALIIAEQKIPDIDYTSPKVVFDNYEQVRIFSSLCIDLAQGTAPVAKDTMRGFSTDKEMRAFDMVDSMGTSIGKCAEDMLKFAGQDADDLDMNRNQANGLGDAAASKRFFTNYQGEIGGKTLTELDEKHNCGLMWAKLTELKVAMHDVSCQGPKCIAMLQDYVRGKEPLEAAMGADRHMVVGGVRTRTDFRVSKEEQAINVAREKTSARELAPPPRQRGATRAVDPSSKTAEKKLDGPGKN